MGAAGATGRAGAGVWGGSLFPLGHVRLGGSSDLSKQIHAPLIGLCPHHGARRRIWVVISTPWAPFIGQKKGERE